MSEPKTLPSSLREKKRYLAYEIISEEPVSFQDVVSAFWSSMLSLLGELGTAKANVWFVKDTWDGDRQRGVIRCRHTAVDDVRAAIATVEEIEDTRAIVQSLGVSGTMKGARKKYLGKRTLEDFSGD